MTLFRIPLKFKFWKYWTLNVSSRRSFQMEKSVRYSIHKIDEKEKRFVISECGMSFFLNFTELNEYISMLSGMSKYDILRYSFFLGKYCTLDKIHEYQEDNSELYQEPTLILEGEDRVGQFKLYDFWVRKVRLLSFSKLIQNKNFIERITNSDLFLIGLNAGRNKNNMFNGLV